MLTTGLDIFLGSDQVVRSSEVTPGRRYL